MKKVQNIHESVSALVWKEDDLYVAKAVEVEVTSQGKTKVEALENLKEALELYFENEPKFNLHMPFDDLSLEKVHIRYA